MSTTDQRNGGERSRVRCVAGRCKKCGATAYVDIAHLGLEEAKARLEALESIECPGRHIELAPMAAFDWDFSSVIERPEPPADEEYLAQLRSRYPGKRIFLLGSPLDGVPSLQELKDLEHIGFGEFESGTHIYMRHDSPRGSRRFYVECPKAAGR